MTRGSRKRLVVSGVNLVEGGTLKVFQDFLLAASDTLDSSWEIIAFINSRQNLSSTRAKLIEVPWVKKRWMNRIYFEWWLSKRLAKRLRPDIWFAIHDITPRVGDVPQVVYCHNPMPFYTPSFKEARYNFKAWLFSLFYGLIYRVNIRKNKTVVVQQDWIRSEFKRRYRLKNVTVAYPSENGGVLAAMESTPRDGVYQFIYPALARPFKNFEVICRAVRILEQQGQIGFRVILTIDERDGQYAQDLLDEFGHLSSIVFVGRQTFDQMRALYLESQCLIFPSRIETWGLPISESKSYGLHILAANVQYARESVGCYGKAAFFDVENEVDLANMMAGLVQGKVITNAVVAPSPPQPFVEGWAALVSTICAVEDVR